MIGYDEALDRIMVGCRPLPPETVPLAQSLGRVLAQDVVAGEDLPPFDNSAMDGFALTAAGEELALGREFTVSGSQAAGDTARDATLEAFGVMACETIACEIMTGASMPAGLDTVVPVEMTTVLASDADGRPQRIRLDAAISAGANVRDRGQDVARGQRILAASEEVTPAARMLMAALGVAEVFAQPRVPVALLTTGRELVDDPRQSLLSGQIRNSNAPYLVDRVHEAGGRITHRETISDDAAAFDQALTRALATGAGVVLSTGAVSMGRYDFVPDALRARGAEIVFHKVAIRPGKPLLFARLPDGQLYFGLPGNPVSAAVGFRFFVEPALRALLGLPRERPLQLPLVEGVNKKAGLRHFQKARVLLDVDGRLHVRVLRGQESFRIRPMLDANGWVVLDEADEQLPAGTQVQVVGLDGRGIRLSALGAHDGN